MSGPIVRTGATPEYWNNWDSVFGKKPGKAPAQEAAPAAKKKVAGKPAAASPAKKVTPAKPAGKATAKPTGKKKK